MINKFYFLAVLIVSSFRADLIVRDNIYVRLAGIERCYINHCVQIRNYTVLSNVISFGQDLDLNSAGNLTAICGIYLPNGEFLNVTSVSADIIPPPPVIPPPSVLWYFLWLSVFIISFPLGLVFII